MNPEAISGIKKASKAAAQVREGLLRQISPGLSSSNLDCTAADLISLHNAGSAIKGFNGFKGNISICTNQLVTDSFDPQLILKEGDLVKIDISLTVSGWTGCCAAAIYLGNSPEIHRLVEVNRSAVLETCDNLSPGFPVNDIDSVLNLSKEEFHQLNVPCSGRLKNPGKQEAEYILNKEAARGKRLKAGDILTVEACFSLEEGHLQYSKNGTLFTDSLNTYHRETVLITGSGAEILTRN